MGDVLNRAGAQWEPRLLATIYAAAALEADDAHGTEHELITQHYGISLADLRAVMALAAEALDGQHADGATPRWNCTRCDNAIALGRVRSAVEWTTASNQDAGSGLIRWTPRRRPERRGPANARRRSHASNVEHPQRRERLGLEPAARPLALAVRPVPVLRVASHQVV
jgi:hypothetical protein